MLLLGWDSKDNIYRRVNPLEELQEESNSFIHDYSIISDRIDELLLNDSRPDISIMRCSTLDENIKNDSHIKQKNKSLSSLLKKKEKTKILQKKDKGKTEEPIIPTKKTITKKEEVRSEKDSFGWKNLGHSKVIFDEEKKENVYTVEEPILDEKEDKLKKKLTHLFRIHTDVDVSLMTDEEKLNQLLDVLKIIIETNKIEIDEKTKDKIFYYLIQEFIGYGKIDILMNDSGIEDISCDGPDVPIFVFHRKYESIKTNIVFTDTDQLDSFAIKLSQLCGKQLSIFEPIVDGRLPDGSRLQTTLGKTVTKGSTFTIRRFNENPLSPIDLIKSNTLSARMAAYFWFVIEFGVSILFCGGTAAGKTTLLNALSLFIPSSCKIVSAEDTREVNLPHENWIAGTTREGFSSGDTKSQHEIDMFDLVKASLRQRPRVIIVGEVRGKEANTMFQAMATGHLSYATMHASDMQTLIQRLENKPISLPRSLMVSLDMVVFVQAIHTREGKAARRVKNIVELVKQDAESNRLITVNPFTWTSPVTDTFNDNGNSKILNDIRDYKGWTKDQLYEELDRREQILEWMIKNNVRDYRDVGDIIKEYSVDQTSVMEKVQQEIT